MKASKILLIISLIISQSSFSQKSQKPENPSDLKLTKSVIQLFKTYDDILQNSNAIDCDFNENGLQIKRKYKWGLMEANEYADGSQLGKISFLSYIWNEYTKSKELDFPNSTKAFRTDWWESVKELRKHFANCYKLIPETIQFPYKPELQNHSYLLLLVPKKTYKKNKVKDTQFENIKDIPVGQLANLAINVTDIKNIKNIKLEYKLGYFKTRNPKLYTDKYSSVGIICLVKLKSGKQLKCYVFNNYDALEKGTLQWKK